MTYETGLYLKLLLHAGIDDSYIELLNTLLEKEPSISGILLELSYVDNDAQEAITLLDDYLRGQKIDHDAVADKLRMELFDLYSDEKMNQSQVVCAFSSMAKHSGHEASEPWYSMLMMEEYYCLAVQGDIDADRFNEAYFDFISGDRLFSTSYGTPHNELVRISSRFSNDKQKMTRSGFFLNHIAPYAYLILLMCLLFAIPALMDANATRYQLVIFALLGLFVFVTIVYFMAGPVIRLRQLPFEMKKVCLEIMPEHRKSRYEFIVNQDHIVINQQGITIGNEFNHFKHLDAKFDSTGKAFPVELKIVFQTKFNRTIEIPICSESLAMLQEFQIHLENEAELDYFLKNTRQAMKDILKYSIVRPDLHKRR